MSSPFAKSRSVFAPIAALSFSANQEQDCIDFLARRTNNTELVPISDEEQLTLNVNGVLTETGYRFNFLGFKSVCDVLAGGLLRLFNEVSGEVPSRAFADDACSIPVAINIYNQTLRVKFEALRERSLLVDHQSRSVDGVLGLNYKMLDNSVFLDLVRSEKEARCPQAIFHRAELVGRELKVYILDPATRRTDVYPNPAHVFATGWYFCNREDAGNSMRAVPCVYTRFGVGLQVENKKQNRLVHVGPDITGKATRLIGDVFKQVVDTDAIKLRVAALTDFKLGFTDNSIKNSAVVKKWTTYLNGLGIPREAGNQIVKNALTVGSDIEPRNPLDIFTKKIMVERNCYDLACSILRFAKDQPTYFRERCQSAGLSLLVARPDKSSRSV